MFEVVFSDKLRSGPSAVLELGPRSLYCKSSRASALSGDGSRRLRAQLSRASFCRAAARVAVRVHPPGRATARVDPPRAFASFVQSRSLELSVWLAGKCPFKQGDLVLEPETIMQIWAYANFAITKIVAFRRAAL